MSAAALTASYISPRPHEKRPASPWEYTRGRRPFMHYSTPRSTSSRRNRALGRALVGFMMVVVVACGLRAWVCGRGQACLPRPHFLSPHTGGGAVLPPSPSQLLADTPATPSEPMMLVPADAVRPGAFANMDATDTAQQVQIEMQHQVPAGTDASGAVVVQDSEPAHVHVQVEQDGLQAHVDAGGVGQGMGQGGGGEGTPVVGSMEMGVF